jgi:hypothetical protein
LGTGGRRSGDAADLSSALHWRHVASLAVQVAPTSRSYPDAIDTRLVLRIYAWLASIAGLAAYAWPPAWVARLPAIDGAPWGPYAMFRTEAAVVVGAGLCAGALAAIDDPVAVNARSSASPSRISCSAA